MSGFEEVTDETFEDRVMRASEPVLVEIGGTWCPPCRVLEPRVREVAAQFEGRVRVVTMDADRAPKTAAALRVRGVPTLVLVRDGREIARQLGAVSTRVLAE